MGEMQIYSAPAVAPEAGGTADGQTEQTVSTWTASEPAEETKTLVEMMQEAREKAEERRKQLTPPKNSAQYGDAAMMAYAKLARARTQAEVSSAAGYARRRILQFQSALRQDGENQERIRAAIAQLQKAVGRASRKKRDLEKEKLLKVRQIRAEQERQRRKAAALRQELTQRRTSRAIRERGYLREADIDNRQQAQMAATRMELRTQMESLSASTAVSLQTAVQGYTAQAAPAPSPAEVSVQA